MWGAGAEPLGVAGVKYECLANPDEMLELRVTRCALPAAIYHPALPYLVRQVQ